MRFKYDVTAFAVPSPIVENITSNRYSVSFGCHAGGLSPAIPELVISLDGLEDRKLTSSVVDLDEYSTRGPLLHAAMLNDSVLGFARSPTLIGLLERIWLSSHGMRAVTDEASWHLDNKEQVEYKLGGRPGMLMA